MDLLWFLRERLTFIRHFYDQAVVPFNETKRKINDGEEPFVPSYTEDGEPRFVEQWIEADQSVDVLGQHCVSMISTALHLYLDAWLDRFQSTFPKVVLELGNPYAQTKEDRKERKGWFLILKGFFEQRLKLPWEESGADVAIIEEVVMARNTVQHPEFIGFSRAKQTKKDFQKYKQSFFADEDELRLYQHDDGTFHDWDTPPWNLKMTREKLESAMVEIERLCAYLEEWFNYARWGQLEEFYRKQRGEEPPAEAVRASEDR